MKHLLNLVAFILLVFNAFAQKTAEEYLASVPALTFNPCTVDYEQKQQFKDEITQFGDSLRADLEARKQASENFQQDNQDEENINVLMKLGYTREQAEKLKNADLMSEEELMAITDEMMMNKNNMTLDDYKKVADLDTAAQQRWAKANSTMYMADADSERINKEQLEIKQDFDLQTELQYQKDKVRAGEDKYLQKLRKLDKEADSAKILLNRELDNARLELENCDNSQCDQIREHMGKLMENYCKRFTPSYLEIVEQFKVYIEHNLPEYYKLEELQIRSLEAQTGVKDPNYRKGTMPIGIVGTYVNLVAGAFKYRVNDGFGMLIIQ